MSAPVRILERLARNAAFGVRFRDTATGSTVIDGLRVEVFPKANPNARKPAPGNRSGVYVAHALSGLRDFEFEDAEPEQLWAAAVRPYRVEVSDPSGRYLPIAFDADLPVRGLFTWLSPWLSPPQPVALPIGPGSPPQLMIEHVPLFSAPARAVPDPLAVLYAHVLEQGSRREVPWNVIAVSIDGANRGLGLTDPRGRVAVMFPYPEPPRVSLASPPEARNDFTWELALSAFGPATASPSAPASAFADLADVFAAFTLPRTVIESVASPSLPLRLTYRQPLVARTAGAVGADASFLFVS